MKNFILIITILVLSGNATAQEIESLNLEQPQQPVATPNQQQEEPQDKVLLPVVVRKTQEQKDEVEANLTDLQPTAIEIGLHKLVLTGKKQSIIKPDGTKDVEIIWDTASIIKEDGEKKTTYIGEPFNSNVSVDPNLAKGDKFSAEGKTSELLAAWQRLMAEEETDEEEEEEIEEREEAPQPSQNFGGNAREEPRPLDVKTPEFVTADDPVITSTSEGCSINVDVAQMAAIVQEKVLQDGVEIAPCSDTLTRYPLEKKYNGCPLFVDTVGLVVQEQFTLVYTDPATSGSVQVQDCTPDSEKSIPIVEDQTACSIRHDFTVGKSFQQSRLTYTDKDGIVQEVQACQDTTTSYDHITTDDTCSSVIDQIAGTVIFQFREKIVVNSVDQFISACAPDPASTVPFQEEDCASPRYTHDFAAGQSYLNKTYFYDDQQGNRVDISVCVQSTVTFTHKEDETVCTATNDDVNKQTTLNAQTYIEETPPTKIYISSCQAVTPTIPYVRLHGLWRQTSQSFNAPVTFTGTQGSQYFSSWSASFGCCIGGGFTYDAWIGASTIFSPAGGCSSIFVPTNWACPGTYYARGTRFCARRDASGGYTISGQTVDTSKSPQSPAIALTSRGFVGTVSGQPTVDYGCSATCSTVTYGEKNPVYQRGDLTTYTDTSINEGTKTVCGNGSLFVGTTEP